MHIALLALVISVAAGIAAAYEANLLKLFNIDIGVSVPEEATVVELKLDIRNSSGSAFYRFSLGVHPNGRI